jgi:hypothetical protein
MAAVITENDSPGLVVVEGHAVRAINVSLKNSGVALDAMGVKAGVMGVLLKALHTFPDGVRQCRRLSLKPSSERPGYPQGPTRSPSGHLSPSP